MLRNLALVSFAALALSACGLRGELQRPVPAWGDPPLEGPNDPRVLKEKADKEQADKAAKAAQRAKETAERDAAAAAAAASPAPSATPTPTPPRLQ
jgi:hypothetical protein